MKKLFVFLSAILLLAGCHKGPQIDPVIQAYYDTSLDSLTARCANVLKAA